MLGFKLGLELGDELGDSDGASLVNPRVGRADTLGSKLSVGVILGLVLGFTEGDSLGLAEGLSEGDSLGFALSSSEGNELRDWCSRDCFCGKRSGK